MNYQISYKIKSNFAAHILQPNHNLSPFIDKYDILKVTYDKKMIDIWENLEIQKHKLKYNLINDKLINSLNHMFNLIIIFRDLYEPYLTIRNIQKITPRSLRINKDKNLLSLQ